MVFSKLIIYIIFFLCFYTKNNNNNNVLIARVNNHFLYKKDLENMSNVDFSDNSLNNKEVILNLVTSWVRKRATIDIAQTQKNFDSSKINLKVLDYKYDLIVHDFLEKNIERQLNYDVTSEDIKKYYVENLNDFELNDNIVQGRFVILPIDFKNKSSFENLFISKKNELKDKLLEFCEQHAIQYHLDTNTWLKFEDFISDTPLQSSRDKLIMLKRIKRCKLYKVVSKKEKKIYYFKIKEYKILNQISPLDFVKEQIKNRILFKRKIGLKNKIIKNILNKTQNQGKYEILHNNLNKLYYKR